MARPIRTCLGCGRKAPKEELVRFVADRTQLAVDPTGRARGRGAYTCLSSDCLERAAKRRAFTRALRRPVEIPPDLQAV